MLQRLSKSLFLTSPVIALLASVTLRISATLTAASFEAIFTCPNDKDGETLTAMIAKILAQFVIHTTPPISLFLRTAVSNHIEFSLRWLS